MLKWGRITVEDRKSVEEESRLYVHLREGTVCCEVPDVQLTEDHLGAALIRHGDSVIIR